MAWLLGGIQCKEADAVFKMEEAQARVHRVHVEHGPVPCAFVQCANCATVHGSPAHRPHYQQKEVGSVCFRWVLHPCSYHSSLAVRCSVTAGPFLVLAYFGCWGAQPSRNLEECSDRSRSRCQESTEEVPVEVPARLCSSRIGSRPHLSGTVSSRCLPSRTAGQELF